MMTLILGGSGSGKSAYAEDYLLRMAADKKKYYIDKYGYETARGTYSSHLAPLDGIYIKKAKIK